jgi:hypothetical protein
MSLEKFQLFSLVVGVIEIVTNKHNVVKIIWGLYLSEYIIFILTGVIFFGKSAKVTEWAFAVLEYKVASV